MQIDVHARNAPLTDAIRTHVVDRFTAALDQHDGAVDAVRVVLRDENGPRGGVDQVCDATIGLHAAEPVRISKRGDDLYRAITDAAEATKQAVGRTLARHKDRR